mmetsp:Transcript_108874/g.339288  ORF Transcript_108874/g.339288 Transcript_108874/m.339288 type:complete len:226 (-) Transcript_108874:509-1186(-)
MQAGALGVDPVLERPLRGLEAVKVPGEGLGGVRLAQGVAEVHEVRMRYGPCGRDPLRRIESEQPPQEVQALLRGAGRALLQRLGGLLLELQRLHEPQDPLALAAALRQPGEVAVAAEPERASDAPQHVQVILAGEERLPGQDLRVDAADRPEVDGLEVARGHQHELRGAVPACDDVVRELLLLGGAAAGEAQVRNAQRAVPVEEDVRGLEVAVHDAGRVEILEAT